MVGHGGELVAAVDVGTGSARAGIFDRTGRLLGRATHPIALRRRPPLEAEHASEDVWAAAAAALRAARAEAGARPEAVAGLAFDATCSLVLRDGAGRPLAAGPEGDDHWDTIAWFDHRARDEAAACTATGHAAVAAQGGAISPEFQIPKLLWLKRRRPETWRRLGRAFDLGDFLAWRATGTDARSHCTLACKWSYGAGGAGWPVGFLAAIGLDDLAARCALPPASAPVGAPLGRLTPAAASEIGLTPATVVAAGLVDAHAGTLAVLAAAPDAGERGFALIAGTSTCVMALARAPRPVAGLWGPYPDAVLPGLALVEGGQSASGALLDHLCRAWSGAEPDEAFHARVWDRIGALMAAEGPDLAPRLHVLPDFHGNRAPFADPHALGVVSGLDLDASFDGLCRLYWRTAVALALGLRQILDAMADQGHPPGPLHLAGGHGRSAHLPRLYADATNLPVRLSAAPDAMLLGSAMAAAAGSRLHPGLGAAAAAMRQPARTIAPDPAAACRMARDYAALLALQRHRRELDALLAEPPGRATTA